MGHQTRPVIGINVDLVSATKTAQEYIRLDSGYFDSVLSAGGLPMIMPPMNQEAEIDAFLEHVNGFILAGGPDIDPRRCGLPRHPAARPMAQRRAEHDDLLLRCLKRRELPILGVGVGMQQLNVSFGGSLHMHIPEDLPRAMPHFDRDFEGPHRHLVLLKSNTRLEEIYGDGELLVNSSHHQCVAQPGDDFRVAATAPDGVIEAIELKDSHWFCIGVQWHPESDTASALDLQLFECFMQACIRQAEPLQLAA